MPTLVVECEARLKSRPLTVDTISDVISPAPLAPTNIFTMKSKIILPPAGVLKGQKFSVNGGREETST